MDPGSDVRRDDSARLGQRLLCQLERMVEFGQMQVNRRWNDYEEMSNRTAAEFAADAKE